MTRLDYVTTQNNINDFKEGTYFEMLCDNDFSCIGKVIDISKDKVFFKEAYSVGGYYDYLGEWNDGEPAWTNEMWLSIEDFIHCAFKISKYDFKERM